MVSRKRYLPRYLLSIVRAFAGSVESAYKDYKLDICDYLEKIMNTEIFRNFENEHCIYTQGYHCIAGKILEQVTDKVKSNNDDIPFDAETAYWMGYVIMYWKLYDPDALSGLKSMDLEGVYWAYDSLHTQDIIYAIRAIKENFIKDL